MQLVLFFTHGISLKTWAENGSLEREIALYLHLQEKGVKVSFVTYGNKNDLDYKKELQGIEVLCNRWKLTPSQYERFLRLLFPIHFLRSTIIKTNQTNGADVALRAAQFWRKPLIARCGYMWSEFADIEGKQEELRQARQVEKSAFSKAKRVVVTTPRMKEYVIKYYFLATEQVQIIPNYVLTDLFSPRAEKPQVNRICFIGRLSEQKNLSALIQACVGLDVELVLIGEGPLRTSLQELAKESGVNINMPGNLPHNQLPDLICQSAIFTLVSTHEGHPKTMLEAMSCEAAVLGADSPGIREQIVHGNTGWLCGTEPDSIRKGIQCLLGNPELRKRLGGNARRFIVQNYSLEKVVEMEYNLLNEIVHEEKP